MTKEFEPAEKMKLDFENSISVAELKSVLIEKLSLIHKRQTVEALIQDCALGNAEQILAGDYLITKDENLVLLPPVCGG